MACESFESDRQAAVAGRNGDWSSARMPLLDETAHGGRRGVRVWVSHHGGAGGLRCVACSVANACSRPTVPAKCLASSSVPGSLRLRLQPSSFGVRLLFASRNSLLRRADAFVAISTPDRRQRCGRAACRWSERITFRMASTPTRFRPASLSERVALRSRLGLPNGPLAIYTGRLVSYKGLTLLLRVWCDLRRSGMSGTLVIVGTGSADMHNCENALRRYVECHGLDDRVIFTGGVDNVDDYLRASDVFVFPTEKEAFGVSLVEAMACGLPSVATRVGGIADFLVDGWNGLVVEPGSFTHLRDALTTLLAGGDRAAAMGQAARTTALSRFSADAVADRYVRLFETLLEQRAV